MTNSSTLDALCSICHEQAPRYRCPRCSARTCTLPCYKRHQQQSQCDGKRDRAAFVSKPKLATPAGVDHDYNYLHNVEWSIGTAQRHASDKGVTFHNNASRDKRPDVPSRTRKLQTAYSNALVTVKYAPVNMTRQKINKTQWDGAEGCICWNVEWIDDTGHRQLGRYNETCTITDAHACAVKQSTAGDGKKRKRNASHHLPTDGHHRRSGQQRAQHPIFPGSSHPSGAGEPRATSSSSQAPPANPADQATASSSSSSKSLHFYLLKPFAWNTSIVLIPLNPIDTLSNALKGRLVFEFPTIYALPQAPDSLPHPYVTEATHLSAQEHLSGPKADRLNAFDLGDLKAGFEAQGQGVAATAGGPGGKGAQGAQVQPQTQPHAHDAVASPAGGSTNGAVAVASSAEKEIVGESSVGAGKAEEPSSEALREVLLRKRAEARVEQELRRAREATEKREEAAAEERKAAENGEKHREGATVAGADEEEPYASDEDFHDCRSNRAEDSSEAEEGPDAEYVYDDEAGIVYDEYGNEVSYDEDDNETSEVGDRV
ncbi:MAG: hypothetical protein M1822_001818 [Bathelium mastoideum]|nr:MAG: hypothetical protein M1822_001818 [Bathelium mastoideum]